MFEGPIERPEPRSTWTEQIRCPCSHSSKETTNLYTGRGKVASETFRRNSFLRSGGINPGLVEACGGTVSRAHAVRDGDSPSADDLYHLKDRYGGFNDPDAGGAVVRVRPQYSQLKDPEACPSLAHRRPVGYLSPPPDTSLPRRGPGKSVLPQDCSHQFVPGIPRGS